MFIRLSLHIELDRSREVTENAGDRLTARRVGK
jgi:hypothetical protein